ncbi:MAG TPA: DMT family transporter [Macromonas sp.]|nr:DMT family transporter [Macromonas sp.]
MPPRTPHPLLGVLFLVLACACFAILDSTFKYLSNSVPVLVAVWFRYVFQAVATPAVALPLRGLQLLRTASPGLQLLRGLLLMVVSVLGVVSLKLMPLADFTSLVMLTPLVITLLAALFLRERVNLLRWLLVLGGFSGAMLVVHPTSNPMGWTLIVPIVTVILYATFQILTSRMARTEDPLTLHLYTGLTGAVCLSFALPFAWQPIEHGLHWWLLLLVGTLGTVGHFLLIQAFARAPASTLAPYLYSQIGFATLIGWWVFEQVPTPQSQAGIALIVVCGALAAWLAARGPTPGVAAP